MLKRGRNAQQPPQPSPPQQAFLGNSNLNGGNNGERGDAVNANLAGSSSAQQAAIQPLQPQADHSSSSSSSSSLGVSFSGGPPIGQISSHTGGRLSVVAADRNNNDGHVPVPFSQLVKSGDRLHHISGGAPTSSNLISHLKPGEPLYALPVTPPPKAASAVMIQQQQQHQQNTNANRNLGQCLPPQNSNVFANVNGSNASGNAVTVDGDSGDVLSSSIRPTYSFTTSHMGSVQVVQNPPVDESLLSTFEEEHAVAALAIAAADLAARDAPEDNNNFENGDQQSVSSGSERELIVDENPTIRNDDNDDEDNDHSYDNGQQSPSSVSSEPGVLVIDESPMANGDHNYDEDMVQPNDDAVNGDNGGEEEEAMVQENHPVQQQISPPLLAFSSSRLKPTAAITTNVTETAKLASVNEPQNQSAPTAAIDFTSTKAVEASIKTPTHNQTTVQSVEYNFYHSSSHSSVFLPESPHNLPTESPLSPKLSPSPAEPQPELFAAVDNTPNISTIDDVVTAADVVAATTTTSELGSNHRVPLSLEASEAAKIAPAADMMNVSPELPQTVVKVEQVKQVNNGAIKKAVLSWKPKTKTKPEIIAMRRRGTRLNNSSLDSAPPMNECNGEANSGNHGKSSDDTTREECSRANTEGAEPKLIPILPRRRSLNHISFDISPKTVSANDDVAVVFETAPEYVVANAASEDVPPELLIPVAVPIAVNDNDMTSSAQQQPSPKQSSKFDADNEQVTVESEVAISSPVQQCLSSEQQLNLSSSFADDKEIATVSVLDAKIETSKEAASEVVEQPKLVANELLPESSTNATGVAETVPTPPTLSSGEKVKVAETKRQEDQTDAIPMLQNTRLNDTSSLDEAPVVVNASDDGGSSLLIAAKKEEELIDDCNADKEGMHAPNEDINDDDNDDNDNHIESLPHLPVNTNAKVTVEVAEVFADVPVPNLSEEPHSQPAEVTPVISDSQPFTQSAAVSSVATESVAEPKIKLPVAATAEAVIAAAFDVAQLTQLPKAFKVSELQQQPAKQISPSKVLNMEVEITPAPTRRSSRLSRSSVDVVQSGDTLEGSQSQSVDDNTSTESNNCAAVNNGEPVIMPLSVIASTSLEDAKKVSAEPFADTDVQPKLPEVVEVAADVQKPIVQTSFSAGSKTTKAKAESLVPTRRSQRRHSVPNAVVADEPDNDKPAVEEPELDVAATDVAAAVATSVKLRSLPSPSPTSKIVKTTSAPEPAVNPIPSASKQTVEKVSTKSFLTTRYSSRLQSSNYLKRTLVVVPSTADQPAGIQLLPKASKTAATAAANAAVPPNPAKQTVVQSFQVSISKTPKESQEKGPSARRSLRILSHSSQSSESDQPGNDQLPPKLPAQQSDPPQNNEASVDEEALVPITGTAVPTIPAPTSPPPTVPKLPFQTHTAAKNFRRPHTQSSMSDVIDAPTTKPVVPPLPVVAVDATVPAPVPVTSELSKAVVSPFNKKPATAKPFLSSQTANEGADKAEKTTSVPTPTRSSKRLSQASLVSAQSENDSTLQMPSQLDPTPVSTLPDVRALSNELLLLNPSSNSNRPRTRRSLSEKVAPVEPPNPSAVTSAVQLPPPPAKTAKKPEKRALSPAQSVVEISQKELLSTQRGKRFATQMNSTANEQLQPTAVQANREANETGNDDQKALPSAAAVAEIKIAASVLQPTNYQQLTLPPATNNSNRPRTRGSISLEQAFPSLPKTALAAMTSKPAVQSPQLASQTSRSSSAATTVSLPVAAVQQAKTFSGKTAADAKALSRRGSKRLGTSLLIEPAAAVSGRPLPPKVAKTLSSTTSKAAVRVESTPKTASASVPLSVPESGASASVPVVPTRKSARYTNSFFSTYQKSQDSESDSSSHQHTQADPNHRDSKANRFAKDAPAHTTPSTSRPQSLPNADVVVERMSPFTSTASVLETATQQNATCNQQQPASGSSAKKKKKKGPTAEKGKQESRTFETCGFDCRVCGITIAAELYEEHLKMTHKVGFYGCIHGCSVLEVHFQNARQLAVHYHQVHKISSEALVGQEWPCQYCGERRFDLQKGYNKHWRNDHQLGAFRCKREECKNIYFRTRSEVLKHIGGGHKAPQSPLGFAVPPQQNQTAQLPEMVYGQGPSGHSGQQSATPPLQSGLKSSFRRSQIRGGVSTESSAALPPISQNPPQGSVSRFDDAVDDTQPSQHGKHIRKASKASLNTTRISAASVPPVPQPVSITDNNVPPQPVSGGGAKGPDRRPRGRPRKNPHPNPDSVPQANFLSQVTSGADGVGNGEMPTPPKRGRGRPRKNPLPPPLPAQVIPGAQDTVPPPQPPPPPATTPKPAPKPGNGNGGGGGGGGNANNTLRLSLRSSSKPSSESSLTAITTQPEAVHQGQQTSEPAAANLNTSYGETTSLSRRPTRSLALEMANGLKL